MKYMNKTATKGSALLVVLGFLTFMIVSAVSFCIYMRVERQGSSNYRHSVTARHLLESSLYRAMDEVDAELREKNTKFPSHWEGRVFVSNSNTPEVEDARVLSLEALSFLPASLVNDARYFSKSTPEEPTFGAKWRRISMPIESSVDIKNNNNATGSGDKSYVGRYAYICVNLSDLININNCTNTVRGVSNLVSVASLFSTTSVAEKFTTQVGLDVNYSTMQDFYACMAVANKNYFGGQTDSPYVQFLKDGKNVSFNDTDKHLLVSDGFAKAQPVKTAAHNVTLKPPFAPAVLKTRSDFPPMNPDFFNKIKEVFPDAGRPLSPFSSIMADYLAPDSVGTMRLDAPSSKLAPMICQVRLAPGMKPMITSVIEGTPPNDSIVYSLNLVSDPTALQPGPGAGLQVRVCFPFKNVDDRIKPYTLDVEGFIRVDKKALQPNLTSDIAYTPPDDTRFTGTATINPRLNDGVGVAQTVQNKCYQWIPMTVNIPSAPMKMADSRGASYNNFDVNKRITVSLVLTSMKVKIGTVIYDSTPQPPQGPAAPQVLYFQTGEASIVAGNPGNPFMMPYLWDSLEVADPRFNHYVCNWVNNMDDPARGSEGIHKLTKDLLGTEGRDADIFMASSGAERLQSVGELGFIVRPYKYDMFKANRPVNFRTKIGPEPANDESEAFFRTIRLYDHGPNHLQDKVYENFYMAMDADGNLPSGGNVRINPLSSVGPIVELAMDRIPYNYYHASGQAQAPLPKQNFTEGVLKTGWANFVGQWANVFTNQIRAAGLNTSFQKTVADFYGDEARMGWYAPKAAVDPDPRRHLCLKSTAR
jgi:hypothetical protein